MDKKYIDQTFTNKVIEYEENEINRLGSLIEGDKVQQECKGPKYLLNATANMLAETFGNTSEINNRTEFGNIYPSTMQ